MPLSKQIKPISYLKANAAEVIKKLACGEPLIVTQNGEAKAVLQDIETWEKNQETLALLKILALGQKQVEEGRTMTVSQARKRLRKRLDQA